MTEVEVHKKINVFGIFSFTRVWKRALPTAWSEVPFKRRLPLLSAISAHAGMQKKILALHTLLKLPNAIFFDQIDPAQMKMLLDQVDWLDDPIQAEPFITEFECNGIQYKMPGKYGQDLNCLEVATAEEYFNELIENPENQNAMALLLCALAGEVDEEGDRINNTSRSSISARAKHFKELDPELQLSSVYFMTAMLKFIRETYSELFNKGEEEGSAQSFGWWGTYFDVAEGGAFGSLEKVHQESFHNVCLYLVKRTREAREREREMERIRNKNKR